MLGPLSDVQEPSSSLLPGPDVLEAPRPAGRAQPGPLRVRVEQRPLPHTRPFPSDGREFCRVLCLFVCPRGRRESDTT